MVLDLKILDAKIVDGSGRPAFSGDVGVKDGLIVEIGRVTENSHRTIAAHGALLTPGFIDPHSHYDAQAMWDEDLTTSCRHGVTTSILGNCGIGFAPLAPGGKQDLIMLMAGVEDVPTSVLEAGLEWNWETFSEYLDRLSERAWTIDVGTQITHDPVRIYVMGERGMNRKPATPEDIQAMREVVAAALSAGAFGFSTGRNDAHRMLDGRDTPASIASEEELVGIAGALRKAGRRVLQLTSDFDMNSGPTAFDKEFHLLEQMARAAGQPLSVNVVQRPGDGGLWRKVIERAEAANAAGMNIVLQVAPRGVGVLMGLNSSFHPFIAHPSFQPLARLSPAERVKAMRDPEVKARILSERAAPYAGKDNAVSDFFENLLQGIETYSAQIFPDRGERNYEPPYSDSLQAEARRRGVTAVEATYDAMLEKDASALLYWPAVNYGSGNLDYVREMLLHPQAVIGLGDAGAHLNNITDYSYTTFSISFWPRKRSVGPGVPVEHIVRLMTSAQADHFGLSDRGLIAVGRRADLNLIDEDRLRPTEIRVVQDLPAGGQRLLQEAEGYLATFKNGVAIVENDTLTGAKPGRLLRAH